MAGIHGFSSCESQLHHLFVCGEGHHIHAGDLAHLVAEVDTVEIMVHGILAYHQVADVQVSVQGTGDTGVHQVGDAEDAAQDLGAHGGVDLAHAALDHHSIHAAKLALAEFHARMGGNLHSFHIFLQKRHFHGHGADNA